MSYMSNLLLTIAEHLEKHPQDKVVGKSIRIKAETFRGEKWLDYVLTKDVLDFCKELETETL